MDTGFCEEKMPLDVNWHYTEQADNGNEFTLVKFSETST
jgi:hypothetical protein